MITGKYFTELLDEAFAIQVDDFLTFFSYEDEEDGEYTMELNCMNEEGLSYEYKFRWTNEDEFETKGNVVFIKDTNRDLCEIVFLSLINI